MPDVYDVLFRTIADPTRRAIFERLCRVGAQTVGALPARAGVGHRFGLRADWAVVDCNVLAVEPEETLS